MKKQVIPLVLLLLLILPSSNVVLSNDETQSGLEDAFIEVNKAERSGGNISNLLNKLNEAINLLNLGGASNIQEAEILINEVKQEAIVAQTTGIQTMNNIYLIRGAILVSLLIIILLIHLFGSKIIWSFWIQIKKSWIVKAK